MVVAGGPRPSFELKNLETSTGSTLPPCIRGGTSQVDSCTWGLAHVSVRAGVFVPTSALVRKQTNEEKHNPTAILRESIDFNY